MPTSPSGAHAHLAYAAALSAVVCGGDSMPTSPGYLVAHPGSAHLTYVA